MYKSIAHAIRIHGADVERMLAKDPWEALIHYPELVVSDIYQLTASQRLTSEFRTESILLGWLRYKLKDKRSEAVPWHSVDDRVKKLVGSKEWQRLLAQPHGAAQHIAFSAGHYVGLKTFKPSVEGLAQMFSDSGTPISTIAPTLYVETLSLKDFQHKTAILVAKLALALGSKTAHDTTIYLEGLTPSVRSALGGFTSQIPDYAPSDPQYFSRPNALLISSEVPPAGALNPNTLRHKTLAILRVTGS